MRAQTGEPSLRQVDGEIPVQFSAIEAPWYVAPLDMPFYFAMAAMRQVFETQLRPIGPKIIEHGVGLDAQASFRPAQLPVAGSLQCPVRAGDLKLLQLPAAALSRVHTH